MECNSNRKRKQSDIENGEFLALSLSVASAKAMAFSGANLPPPPPPPSFVMPAADPPATTHHRRQLIRNPARAPLEGKNPVIPPPYPWAGTGRATVRSLNYLRAQGITAIFGDVECRKCEEKFVMEFDLEERFAEISTFVAENQALMRHRAPNEWKNPELPRCDFCNQEGSVKPVISAKKRSINWLFLLMGKMLGCCTLEQLKYFCKHTKNHRTGAKDRVLFLTYLSLCKQMDPSGPYDVVV
ncbi:uncharacterized protein LOC121744268 [Salvia splendens]|uniref:uncharacterized protein LOC121744268 n=1 Tax=Salvia splendens TaxID=180675 RepID=UPI001C26BC9F|nr:uncharacterized protein LOC121744268 [Salvia splendens]